MGHIRTGSEPLPWAERVLIRVWSAHMEQKALFTGPEGVEVPAGLDRAETPIGTTANSVDIMLVLPVVLPEAHRAYLVSSSFIECQEPTVNRPGFGAHLLS